MAWLLLATTWCLLLLAGALAPWLGREAALVGGHTAATLLLVRVRPAAAAQAPRAPAPAVLLVAATGFVALPAWLAGVWALGLALGLPAPSGPGAGPLPGLVWLAQIALAPTFEELLYRERLLPALRSRLGAPAALVCSSALFAVPHLDAWSMLATFCVGLFLGALWLAGRRVALCIGYHAGANAAVLVSGLPPERLALDAASAALVSGLGVAFALAWTRGLDARRGVHDGEPGARGTAPRQARRLLSRPACHRSPIDP
jgi:membrane protease YdiL (CAAX protease family)